MNLKDYTELVKIEKHQGYWVNPASQVIYWRGTIKGKKLKLSTRETQITKAKKYVEDYILSLTAENLNKAKREQKGIKNPGLSILWNELIEERKASRSDSTIMTYHNSWKKKLGPFWGDKHVKDVNQRNIVKFENWFLETFPDQSYFNAGKHLKMFLNFLYRDGYISSKIEIRDLEKIIHGKAKKKKPFRIYTDKEKQALIACAVSDRARVCLVAYFETGMRKMELLSRKWLDVDFKDGMISIWSSKNKKWRTVPMTKLLKKELLLWREISPLSEYIFPMQKDPSTHISGQYFDKDWIATKKASKVRSRARVHDIRHTFATKTAVDGWPMPLACKALDMSAKEYMKTYVHITPKDINEWMKRSFG